MDSHVLSKLPRKPLNLIKSANVQKANILKMARVVYRDYRTVHRPSAGLPSLLTDGFDNEQLFNMLELVSAPEAEAVSEEAIDRLTDSVLETGGEEIVADSGVETSSQEEDGGDGDDDDDDESDVALSSDEEHEMITKRIASRLENDEDDFDELAEEEEDDVNEEEEEEEEDGDMENESGEDSEENEDEGKEPKQATKANVKSAVDDEFFKLNEMEEFLDKEDRKAMAAGGESEEEGMLEDVPSDEDEAPIMYGDFFDPPKEERRAAKRKSKTEKESASAGANGKDGEDADSDSDEPEEPAPKKQQLFDDDEEDDEQGLSFHEKRMKRIQAVIEEQESLNLKAKSWQMAGEVTSRLRPENSLLEVTVSHTTAAPADPEVTEKHTEDLESWIKQRIKDKAWDDVVRKVKPKEDSFQYRKRITLDSNKSEKSLMAEYENIYLQQTQPGAQQEEAVDPKKEAIKKSMRTLFLQLDALTHFNYTPRKPASELRIVNNTPALSQEEVAPVGMSDAALVAPEEVQTPMKRELKATSERTAEDKKWERRKKKIHQRKKFQEQEEKEKLKGPSRRKDKKEKEKALKDLEKKYRRVSVLK